MANANSIVNVIADFAEGRADYAREWGSIADFMLWVFIQALTKNE